MSSAPGVLPEWQQEDVFGGMSEQDYAKLPELYRAEVAELRAWAERRDAVHRSGGNVPMEEMDQSGARENELRLPPLVSLRLMRMSDQYATALALMLADDEGLVDEAERLLRECGATPAHHRFAAQDLVVDQLSGATRMMAIGLEETLINALKHGIHGDMRKRVILRRQWTPELCRTQVEDEGLGYVRDELPDPLTALASGHGRGLLLTETYADGIERNERGTLVTMTVRRASVRRRILNVMGQHLNAEAGEETRAKRMTTLAWKLYVPGQDGNHASGAAVLGESSQA